MAPLVLFDEAHSEAWTIREALARQMQPVHPADASLGRAADALRENAFDVEANRDLGLTADTLNHCDLLVIAHPSDPQWERTTGTGSPRLSEVEIEAIDSFVTAGGGLVVLGETEQGKYGNNLNELLARFGLELETDTVQDYEHNLGAPTWILAELGQGERGQAGDLLARVRSACLYRATTIAASNGARVLARTHSTASTPGAPVIVAADHGAGRVVVLADSDVFGDDCIDALDHRALWLNICFWAARGERPTPAARRPAALRAAARRPGASGAGLDSTWRRLRDHTNALALFQASDGAIDGGRTAAAEHVGEIRSALSELAPCFPHQGEYIEQTLADLGEWAAAGMGKPDFTRALNAFRPDRHREDGIEHVVFFPMYKQNGSRETCFEALIVRVPWPDWIAELERTRYDNPQFVPVELVDGTRGYDSECATLFPETVSVAERPVNHFGAIFCDREAARLRRIAGAAADLLALNLPPDAARMLSSPLASEHTYILWDLIHDRTHSRGELPFDPFMIRQRAPYWMYSLEELRCDLTAFAEAGELARGPLPFARNVQYAILLDRLLRFPITGSRRRNYDGLGGQLLFAYLHRHGHLRWSDNQLTVDWEGVGEGVVSLREELEELYRAGIDRTKLQHWCAAHDLISASVPPAFGSRWATVARGFPETDDPRPYVDQVLDDEFPLSIFYTALKAKLAA
jgi:Family of unknown function (DUF6421)